MNNVEVNTRDLLAKIGELTLINEALTNRIMQLEQLLAVETVKETAKANAKTS